jgi:hypothetical protein
MTYNKFYKWQLRSFFLYVESSFTVLIYYTQSTYIKIQVYQLCNILLITFMNLFFFLK